MWVILIPTAVIILFMGIDVLTSFCFHSVQSYGIIFIIQTFSLIICVIFRFFSVPVIGQKSPDARSFAYGKIGHCATLSFAARCKSRSFRL